MIGKAYELYSGGQPLGETVGSCPQANSKVPAWPWGFLKEFRTVNKGSTWSLTFLDYIPLIMAVLQGGLVSVSRHAEVLCSF